MYSVSIGEAAIFFCFKIHHDIGKPLRKTINPDQALTKPRRPGHLGDKKNSPGDKLQSNKQIKKGKKIVLLYRVHTLYLLSFFVIKKLIYSLQNTAYPDH